MGAALGTDTALVLSSQFPILAAIVLISGTFYSGLLRRRLSPILFRQSFPGPGIQAAALVTI